jgi:hydroxyethylthiazole kinase-like uncharacterized protein yjeF
MRFPRPSLLPPTLNFAQRRTLDDLLLREFGISALQQQEIIGAAAAELAREAYLKGNCRDKGVVVLAGNGPKGGMALACARRLHAWGARVRVCHVDVPPKPSAFTESQLHSLQRMGVIAVENPAQGAILVIDGLLDLGESAQAHARAAELISWANQQIHPVISIDLPSGLHPDSGAGIHAPVVRASSTLAVALPLQGLFTEKARPMVGEIYLADLGVPRTAWAAPRLGIELGWPFAESGILKLR